MINQLLLKNFKIFKEETTIPLASINLLTGINGRGKSTVMQALLLMMQSPEFDRNTHKIILNGDNVKLGGYKDVRNVSSAPIEFTFFYPNFSVKYLMQEDAGDSMVADIVEIQIQRIQEGQLFIAKKEGEFFNLSLNGQPIHTDKIIQLDELFPDDSTFDPERAKINFTKMHYVSADRVGPKLYYTDKSIKDFLTVGSTGEDTVNVLFHAKNDPVDMRFIDKIMHFFHVATEDLGTTVEFQTEFWLDKIFKGVKYEIKRVDEANLLTFSISPDGTFNYYKPTNVGYGYSYVLPIIVAGLVAKPGEILIVENPEAHLHPFAQSILAKFLTLVSLKDVQVIVESHSEHILNGLRLAVNTELIKKEQLSVLYFDRDFERYFEKINIDDKGGINNWPPDFFDQATNDLNLLLGI